LLCYAVETGHLGQCQTLANIICYAVETEIITYFQVVVDRSSWTMHKLGTGQREIAPWNRPRPGPPSYVVGIVVFLADPVTCKTRSIRQVNHSCIRFGESRSS
jgi:hypothetical protein